MLIIFIILSVIPRLNQGIIIGKGSTSKNLASMEGILLLWGLSMHGWEAKLPAFWCCIRAAADYQNFNVSTCKLLGEHFVVCFQSKSTYACCGLCSNNNYV